MIWKLHQRAQACADGFRAIGLTYSADFTQRIADNIAADPSTAPLYAHWISQQEQRLADKRAIRMGRAA